jgi:GNAT superfamily N-acetyltransferase
MDDVRIISFEAAYRSDFRDLNLAWVSKYFTVEAKDHEQLENPQERIIDRGGVILLAQNARGAIIGCVSLIPYKPGVLELAKMAVHESAQGCGVGRKLIEVAIDKARLLGARSIYLESNSILGPALRLYERAGFKHLPPEQRPSSAYTRCNVYMMRNI